MHMRRQMRLGFVLLAAAALVVALLHAARVPTLPSLADARYRNPMLPVEDRIDDLVSRMTLDEKIGQMALVEKNSIRAPEDVARYGLGGILSGAGGKPVDNTPAGWLAMITSFVDASRESRTGIPILYGLDANHGHGNVPGATIFPHAIGIGAIDETGITTRIAYATAQEVLATGATWVYSPSLDLPKDIRWGRVYEAFSDDPEKAGRIGAAFVRGLEAGGVVATPKHFLGLGSMQWNTSINKNFKIDQGMTPPDETRLRSEYLPPFKAAVDAGAQSVMIGLNMWGETDMAASHYLLTDVLKGELGFEGVVVSDWYGVHEISHDSYLSSVTGINAGIDMVMLPFDYVEFTRDVRNAVARGDIAEARIDDAVRRILRVKFERGLFDGNVPPPLSVVGSLAHRALAREAAARSTVVLKNNGALPLTYDLRTIRVAGSAADNVGRQTGAWTVEWQGIDGNWLPGATSILKALRSAAVGASVEYAKDGVFAQTNRADVGIAFVGEKPYAEGWGDTPEPRLSEEDLQAIENLSKSSRAVVVVIVSGRPLLLDDELVKWDALVAAWLPGSEGDGVIDALYGIIPTGTLPLQWPRAIEGSALYERGYGLRLD